VPILVLAQGQGTVLRQIAKNVKIIAASGSHLLAVVMWSVLLALFALKLTDVWLEPVGVASKFQRVKSSDNWLMRLYLIYRSEVILAMKFLVGSTTIY